MNIITWILLSIITFIIIIILIMLLYEYLKKRKNNKIKNNNKIINKKINYELNENKKKRMSKNTKNKILLYILIGIISILAIAQTILLLSVIFSFIAYALAVPTTLLTIVAIIKYIEINKHD